MPETTNGRAGSFKPAAAPTGRELIDRDAAMAWGEANGVNIKGARALDRINARRKRLALPGYDLTPPKHKQKGTISPPAKSARVVSESLAASENDLLYLVMHHEGTRTAVITPVIAGWLLALNTGNRPIQKSAVERFRAIIKAGKWVNTGEPIIVSREGVLNDGQHRLTAIQDTGTSVIADIRFGIEREAFQATGTGMRRSPGDVLAIEGYTNVTAQGSIARLLLHYDARRMGQVHERMENGDILAAVEADERIGQVAAKIRRFRLPLARTAPFGVVLVIALRTAPVNEVFAFADIAATGLHADEDYPPRRLHSRFSEIAHRRTRLHAAEVVAMTIHAWNAWVDGERLPAIKVVEADRTSAGFPKAKDWPAGGRVAFAPQEAAVDPAPA